MGACQDHLKNRKIGPYSLPNPLQISANIPTLTPHLLRAKERTFDRNYPTTDVQNAHLRAATGISLWHSGHVFLSGSARVSFFFNRAIKAFTGTTTK